MGMAIRNRVRVLVDRLELTVYRFGKATGISQTTAYALYNNPGQYLGKDVMDAICRVYGVQPGELLEWVEDSEPGTAEGRDPPLEAGSVELADIDLE